MIIINAGIMVDSWYTAYKRNSIELGITPNHTTLLV